MAADFYDLKLSGIIQETVDTRSFLLEIPEALRELFRYKAGQFLTFDVPWNGLRLKRCYSLASAPETDARPKVTVKRVAEGRVSNWFNDAPRVGDTLRVQPPEGRFVLREDAGWRPLTLFGGGSGITPIYSLLKAALHSTDRPIRLVYANRDPSSVIFREELELLVRKHGGRVELVHHMDSESGFLTREAIARLLLDRLDSDVYVCGPGPFMDAVEAALDEVKLPSAQRFFERFVSPTDPDRREAAPEPPAVELVTPGRFRMTMDGRTLEIPCPPGKTILQAAEAAGHKPPSSCEDGYCGCCMGRVREGTVHLQAREALTDQDIERGWILACQARPTGTDPPWIDFDAQY